MLGESEAQGNLRRVRTFATLTQSELRRVVAPTVHGLQESDDAVRTPRKFFRKPLAKKSLDLEWKPQKHITCISGTGIASSFKNRLDFVIGQPWNDRCDHDGDGNARLRQLPHRFEAP